MNDWNFSRGLRIAGALALLVSSSTFLLGSWEGDSDLLRYAVFLGHSIVLFAGAFFCGAKLRDQLTARALLWTATALVPFQVAALGGLIYSQFAFEPAASDLPVVATWIANSRADALLALAVSVPAFALIARFTARVLSPALATTWSWTFVAQSLLFLVPVRHPEWTSVLVGVGCAVPLLVDRRFFFGRSASENLEGRLLRGLLWASPIMIALRTTIFYAPGPAFWGTVLLASGVTTLVLARRLSTLPKGPGAVVEILSAVATSGGAALLSFAPFSHSLDVDWAWAFACSTVAGAVGVGVALALARFSTNLLRCVWILGSLLLGVPFACLTSSGGPLLPYLLLFCGLALATLRHQPALTLAAGAGGLACVVNLLRLSIGFQDMQAWQVLSASGVAAFGLSVLVEKKRVELRRWLSLARATRDTSSTDRQPQSHGAGAVGAARAEAECP